MKKPDKINKHLFGLGDFIRDVDCTRRTPVIHGRARKPVYGHGIGLTPGVPGKRDTPHDEEVYLPQLLPLEEYDDIVLLFSGGKDSLACYFVLRELGVPKERISLWHHDIDGGQPKRRMDWPATQAYVRAFAEAEGVTLQRSWRQNGFFGELYRVGAAFPIQFEDKSGGVHTCKLSEKQARSLMLLEKARSAEEQAELESYGMRLRFPAKSGNLLVRWCSPYLKIMVADSVLRDPRGLAAAEDPDMRLCGGLLEQEVQSALSPNLHQQRDRRILVVSGERRGESAGRALYNEMELHRTNAQKIGHRLVHQWRPVIDYHEGDVWAVLQRHNVRVHPCYYAGWSRCSCMMCVFSQPRHWAGIRELFPADFAALQEDERRLHFTLDNKLDLAAYVGDAESCVYPDTKAIWQLTTGNFTTGDVYTAPGAWSLPAGAFHGGTGGPC